MRYVRAIDLALEALHRLGADLTAATAYNTTPMTEARRRGHADVVALLQRCGATSRPRVAPPGRPAAAQARAPGYGAE